MLGTLYGGFDGDVREGRAIDGNRYVGFFKLPDEHEEIGIARKTRIRDDKRTPAETCGDAAESMSLSRAEQ